MTDISNEFRLSQRATEVANRFIEEGWFKYNSEVALYAAAYIIRTKFESFDPGSYVVPDSSGSNYNITSFDNDGTWSTMISALYNTDTPRLYFRNIIVYGLELFGDIISENGSVRLSDFILV